MGTLEESGEFGVAVGHVAVLAVDQRRDDVAERRQAQVDLGGLAQPLAGRARLRLPLAARQVHQVQLAHLTSSPSFVFRHSTWRPLKFLQRKETSLAF